MSTPNNLKLLLFSISLFLLFSPLFAALDSSPSPSPDSSSTFSPASSPDSDWDDDVADGPDSPSPSPVADGPVADGPVADGPNSPSPSPAADGPVADGPNSPSPSPAADGPSAPSPSPVADGPTSDAPSLSPEAAAPTGFGLAGGPSGANADVLRVLEIAIRSSADLAKAGLDLAKAQLNNTSLPPEQTSMLMECRDSYDYAVYNIENAIEALPERDVETIKSMFRAVVEDVGDCEKRAGKFGGDNPFSGIGDKLVSMTSNCLNIAAQM